MTISKKALTLYFAATMNIMPVICCAHPQPDLSFYLVESGLQHKTYMADTDLSTISLAPEPFLEISDIKSYNWNTHAIELTAECRSRLRALFGIGTRKPLIYKGFVVTVDGEPAYLGMLLSNFSSFIPADIPRIWVPIMEWGEPNLQIVRGGQGFDVRRDKRVWTALAGENLIPSPADCFAGYDGLALLADRWKPEAGGRIIEINKQGGIKIFANRDSVVSEGSIEVEYWEMEGGAAPAGLDFVFVVRLTLSDSELVFPAHFYLGEGDPSILILYEGSWTPPEMLSAFGLERGFNRILLIGSGP